MTRINENENKTLTELTAIHHFKVTEENNFETLENAMKKFYEKNSGLDLFS